MADQQEKQQQQEKQERPPRSLNDLLKWSIKYHATEEDRTQPSQYGAMDPARREFLEKALKNLTVNELDLIRNNLEILDKEDDGSLEEVDRKEQALDDILSLIDSLDNARDLQIIGGYNLVIKYLESPFGVLRSKAAEIVGTVVQNDVQAQKSALNSGTLPLLFSAFKDPSPNVRKKVVFALSSLIRQNGEATVEFFKLGGIDLIRNGISDGSAEVEKKVIFLLLGLLSDNEALREEAQKRGLIPILVQKLSSDDFILREHSIAVLASLVEQPSCIAALKDSSLKLKEILQGIIQQSSSLSQEEREKRLEEIEHAKALWKTLFEKA